jgi:dihydrofolate reductase
MNVTLIAAQTIDGYIARNETDRSFDWTSQEDKQFYISKLKESDAVVMSSKTFRTFSKYPKGAHFVIVTRNPEQIENPNPERIKFTPTNKTPQQVLTYLKDQNCRNVLIAGGASIYRQYLSAKVVDTVFLTIEPIIFGKGISLLDDSCLLNLSLKQIIHLSSQTIVLQYSLNKNE